MKLDEIIATTLLVAVIAGGIILGITAFAKAQEAPLCAPYQAAIRAFNQKQFVETAGALENDESPWIVLTNPAGSYVMLVVIDGMACLASKGEGWFVVPRREA